MLLITIPAGELYDEEREIFLTSKEQDLALEHSLVSLSKWESSHHKAFLSNLKKTIDEDVDYIKCMTMTQNVDPMVYKFITPQIMTAVNDYINDPMTATTFSKPDNNKVSREVITAEIIYYWMITLNIPPEYQKWHLNRLLTLINVCRIKNSPGKKMGKADILRRNRELNASRKALLNTPG